MLTLIQISLLYLSCDIEAKNTTVNTEERGKVMTWFPKMLMLCKMYMKTQCDNLQSFETPWFIENGTKTYQMKWNENHMPILKMITLKLWQLVSPPAVSLCLSPTLKTKWIPVIIVKVIDVLKNSKIVKSPRFKWINPFCTGNYKDVTKADAYR